MTITRIPGCYPGPPLFDARCTCPGCGVSDLGVRRIHAELSILAAHSSGHRRVMSSKRPRCVASELPVRSDPRAEVR